ncbi:MAG: pyruvate:ferredoxin (flavodoxin) oxidoreductase [Phycisphaerales bacterium]|nr:MAG: pyruvate:ferredoxin (flavodoxin) oxidoreductase [Phycisphaerales bacterium]
MDRRKITIDGNEAAASVAHRLSETIAIYPITPSSPMGEWADEWSAKSRTNIWGTVPSVTEMQSEAGAAGAVHGTLQRGALATTFTASQGLLLMIPNMFKIAGELTPTVFHVSARTVATHALSIFGDHSDVMAARSTGFAMLASGSVQEVMDLAAVAHSATLVSRIPFLHFFEGFRTSHEVIKIEELTDDDLRAMIDDERVFEHRARAMNPDKPVLRGTAQNPDVFFQARETINPYYHACPGHVQDAMDRFAKIVGRQYHLFDYVGAPDAERVIVAMGSGAEAVHETVDYLTDKGEKVGLVKVRLFRPFSNEHLIDALPPSTKTIAVLDRTKEPGAAGEPLYQNVITALMEHATYAGNRFKALPRVIGGRYGLSSKEFTPAMVKGVLDEMVKDKPKNHFCAGIEEDVTNSSVEFDPSFTVEDKDSVRALFYGLGADGTVGANKNSIKIIGEETDNCAQGYFVYDSKKAGSITVSHLRFGKKFIRAPYLIQNANFVACHAQTFIEKYEMLAHAEQGATFLLCSQKGLDEVWDSLPREVQDQILEKEMKFYVIDAYKVAKGAGMGARINTIMQVCFFAISGVLPREEAIQKIKGAIKKTYGPKGEAVVQKNYAAVDQALANLHEVSVPKTATSDRHRPAVVADEAPEFVQEVTSQIMAGKGDSLPTSSFPADGTFPTDTSRWEKANIALEIPVWDPETCIQCNKCSFVCPHAAIRPNVYEASCLDGAPATFKSVDARGPAFKGLRFTVQVAPEDCTGCGSCVQTCPAKNKSQVGLKAINLSPQAPLREAERENYGFFLELPEYDRSKLNTKMVKESQLLKPLFEYSGACVGCGETPYVKLLSQLFGDRAIIANATGCSSIYGGNLPTTPWAQNKEGRGPTWCNSLFEDNAEFGLGFRLAIDKQSELARELLQKVSAQVGAKLAEEIINADQSDEAGIAAQRERLAQLKTKLDAIDSPESRNLLSVIDTLCKRSVWVLGGDGWAYDIGFGGLDHVLASGRNVNVLVVDTEVYSNTGGQMSKATPLGAVAKFAAAGKSSEKKDLGMIAMSYGTVYVAQVAMGANDAHTAKVFVEAESYDGPSLIIAYSHCIAHGINMREGLSYQKAAVECGFCPLYRFDPRRTAEGLNPLQLDSKAPKIPVADFVETENRFNMLLKSDPERGHALLKEAQRLATARYEEYARRAQPYDKPDATGSEETPKVAESAAT